MKRLLLIVEFAVFYFTLAVGQTAQVQPEQKFRLIRESMIVVRVEINGQGPFLMVLDTGTGTTLVDTTLAQKLALPALDRTRLNAINEDRVVVRSSISRIAVGAAKADDVEALVQDLTELRKLDSRIVGVLGQNFLARFNYLINYGLLSLQFEDGSELLGGLSGTRVPFTIGEQGLLISGEIGATKKKVSLVLDSGVNSVVLFQRGSKAAIQVTDPRAYRGTTVNGNQLLGGGMIGELKIGLQKFYDLPVGLLALEPADRRSDDGLLPTSLFHSLYVNNRYGFVIFNCRSMHRQ